MQFNSLQTGDASNDFSFTSAFTQGPNPAQSSNTAGNALATFLLGIPGGSVTPSPALAMETKYFAGYLQDDWKVSNKFTINFGIRYELETPRTERYNRLTNFDYGAVPPLSTPGLDLSGTLSFVNANGLSRYDSNVDANNIAPRFGFAWHATPKTVIRAGGGMFYGTNWGFGGAAKQLRNQRLRFGNHPRQQPERCRPHGLIQQPVPNGPESGERQFSRRSHSARAGHHLFRPRQRGSLYRAMEFRRAARIAGCPASGCRLRRDTRLEVLL